MRSIASLFQSPSVVAFLCNTAIAKKIKDLLGFVFYITIVISSSLYSVKGLGKEWIF